MIKKLNTFFKNFDEKVLKGGAENLEPKPFNFKGQRFFLKNKY